MLYIFSYNQCSKKRVDTCTTTKGKKQADKCSAPNPFMVGTVCWYDCKPYVKCVGATQPEYSQGDAQCSAIGGSTRESIAFPGWYFCVVGNKACIYTGSKVDDCDDLAEYSSQMK